MEVRRETVRVTPDGRVSTEDAAKYLGFKRKTLHMWAMSGEGPPRLKIGGRVFYRISDLDAFIEQGATR